MTNTSRRGFAAMDPEKRRATASKGGRAAHLKGTAHQFASEEARAAGRKGGQVVSRDKEHMAAIGRKGRQSAAARSAMARATNSPPQPQPSTNGHPQSQPETTVRTEDLPQNALVVRAEGF